jgi:hypothetical protein
MNKKSASALTVDYYVNNFHALVSFVTETYDDLLTPDEKSWYATICSLSDSGQRLYIRLLSRQRSTFRISRLGYTEISNLTQAAAELAANGLSTGAPVENLQLLVQSFTKRELINRLELQRCDHLSRGEMLERIVSGPDEALRRHLRVLQRSDNWVTPLGHHHFTFMQLCFFGNLHQGISEFVMRDLGNVRYANYEIFQSARPFRSRQQIEAHLKYYELVSLFDSADQRSAKALLQLVDQLPYCPEDDKLLRRRVDRFRNSVARQLERLSCHEAAMRLYEQAVCPPARERRVRWLLSELRLNEAHELCRQMLNKPFHDAEAQVAQRLMKLWRKSSNLPVEKTRRFRPQVSRLVLKYTTERVERAACEFYNRRGQCHYVENSLFNGVLGLLIWDAVFQSVPGAFFNPFQSAPADFYQPAFTRNRDALISLRFSEIKKPTQFQLRVLNNFELHYGTANPFVHWQKLEPPLLSEAIKRIPGEHWLAIFKRMICDLRENMSGLPDLIFFPPGGGYELIEVKGPGDTLQANQQRWLAYFYEHQISSRVVKVQWSKPLTTDKN